MVTYPSFCIRSTDFQRIPRIDSKPIVKSFLQDLQQKVPSVCNSPLRFRPEAKFTTTNLHDVAQVFSSSIFLISYRILIINDMHNILLFLGVLKSHDFIVLYVAALKLLLMIAFLKMLKWLTQRAIRQLSLFSNTAFIIYCNLLQNLITLYSTLFIVHHGYLFCDPNESRPLQDFERVTDVWSACVQNPKFILWITFIHIKGI